MCDTAAHLVDNVLPQVPVRQWVLTVPHGLRYAMAHNPALAGVVLRVFMGAVSWAQRRRARKQGLRGVLKTGAVTVIQRFDSALALNVHFHSLVLDGVYAMDSRGRPVFHPVAAPTDGDVAEVAARVFRRVSRMFDPDADDVAGDSDPLLAKMSAASLRRLVATGPRRGRPVRRLGHDVRPQARILGKRCADVEGFNVHANVRIAANDRVGLEGLCRYIARPPLSVDRLTELPDGNLMLRLKRSWSDGTTHLVLSPGELIEKLVPLVPRPRAHITRYHGVFAPAAGWRPQVVPQNRSVAAPVPEPLEGRTTSGPAHGRRTRWAELLKRVFLVDALVCPRCPGRMKILAVVLRPDAIKAILEHGHMAPHPPPMAPARAPPEDNGGWDGATQQNDWQTA